MKFEWLDEPMIEEDDDVDDSDEEEDEEEWYDYLGKKFPILFLCL